MALFVSQQQKFHVGRDSDLKVNMKCCRLKMEWLDVGHFTLVIQVYKNLNENNEKVMIFLSKGKF